MLSARSSIDKPRGWTASVRAVSANAPRGSCPDVGAAERRSRSGACRQGGTMMLAKRLTAATTGLILFGAAALAWPQLRVIDPPDLLAGIVAAACVLVLAFVAARAFGRMAV